MKWKFISDPTCINYIKFAASSPSVYEQMPVDEKPVSRSNVPMEEESVPSPTEPEQPVLVQRPHNCRYVEGTNAIFECRVTGAPFPEIIWKRKGFPIRNDSRYALDQISCVAQKGPFG